MITYLGTTSDTTNFRLPADAMHPLFALSLRRKLRYLYSGNYFRYETQGGQQYEYPEQSAGLDGASLVVVFDQKEKFGYPKFHASQFDATKRPVLSLENGLPVANFTLGQFLDMGNAGEYITSPDFTITSIGDGDIPRPMIGVYGESDSITVEPGSPTNRFTFNDNFGSVGENTNNRINQLFSGLDPSQNGKRVITMKSDGAGRGQNLSNNTSTNFTTISIGKSQDRFFQGTFIEATMHLNDLTRLGANQLWEEAKLIY